MSLTTLAADGILISNNLHDGTWQTDGLESGSTSPTDWDTLQINQYKHLTTQLTPELAAAAFPVGTKLGSRNFWSQGHGFPVCLGGNLWRVPVTYKGYAAAKGTHVTYGTSAEQQSAENIFITGVGTFAKVSIHQNTPTVTARYISTDFESDARTDDVGKVQTPPQAPTDPDNFWLSLVDPVYHYPNGWVLMSSDADPLPGTTVAWITDTYQFIQNYTP